MTDNKKTIVVLHGSLRETSSSAAVISCAAKIIGNRADIIPYKGTGQLPHFDDKAETPLPVKEFHKLIADADAVLICTPEYAFGIPGTLKNALDWCVGSGAFDQKPVALITASSQGQKGHTAMLNVLAAINSRMNNETQLLISYIRSKIDSKGEVSDENTINDIRKVVEALLKLMDEPTPY